MNVLKSGGAPVLRRVACVLGLATALASMEAGGAGAVVTRDDVPDARYVAAGGALASYCRMNAPDGGGVLVAPRWVLTAAHMAPDLRVGATVTCGGRSAAIAAVIPHPDWNGARNDIALVELATPIDGVTPALVSDEPVAVGQTLNLIGHWRGGTGRTGVDDAVERRLRGATNRVSQVDPFWIRFVMDDPRTGHATDLEGVSGGGDSGAPAWLERDGRAYVVGVGSHSRDLNRDGREQDYGDEDVFARVGAYAGWIRATVRSLGG